MGRCGKCESKCCRYLAMQIDTPKNKSDFEHIRWYLAHEKVTVFIDKRKWYLEVQNKCEYLTEEHMCAIYDKRPLICREHDNDECEGSGADVEYDEIFTDILQFDEYLKKRFKGKRKFG